ncbi:MAG TPA: gliding motility-associated C-terminal domain-containing protein [Bacteroidia bacterium]|nr:gliding motility-associated C-terminal domain-containing protein [Bacteroidia bacterium]
MKRILLLFILGTSVLGFTQTKFVSYHEANSLKPIKNNLIHSQNLIYLDATKTFDLPVDGAFLYSSLDPESGIISSGYNNNENYTLTIKNQYNRKIFIRSHYFSTESKNDILTIYDGKDTSSKIIKSISGYLDENFALMSSGEYLTIHFKSNHSVTSKGFRFRIDNGPGINSNQGSLPNPLSCASTPAADECVNAPLICDLNGYCGNTSGAYTAGNTSGLGNFCGSIENNSWLSFVASGTTASLAFNSAGCQDNSSGIQAVIYASSNCTSFTEVSNCESQGSGSGTFTITTNVALVPGQTYYVMVDGFAGNVCSYTVGAQSGVALGQQLTGPNQLCPGFSGTLGSSSTASSYSWTSSPPGVYPNTQSISISPTVPTTYTLTLGPSACNPAGINIVKTVTVTNTLNPANITAPNLICMGTNITLASLTNGGTYAWTGPNGYTSTSQNASVNNWSPSNNGVYTLIINYGSGCATAPATVNLTGTPSPTIDIVAAPSLTVCSGQSVVLTGSGAAAINSYNWTWNFSQTSLATSICNITPSVAPVVVFGNTITPAIPSQTNCVANPLPFPISGLPSGATATATPNQNTQICVSGQNAAGCSSSKCVNIVVLPAAPALTISPTATICPGQSTTLTVSGGGTYTWSPSSGLSSANGASVTANPTLTTIYTVSTTVCGGSIATKTVQVVVSGAPINIGTIAGPSVVCANSTGVTYSVTNVSGANYTWAVPGGANITAGANTNAITVNFGASAGTVSVSAVGSCGSATASLNVTTSPSLSLTVSPLNPTICSGSSTTLTASGATNYTWSPSSTLSSSNGNNVTASPTVTTVYTILGSSGTCTGSTTSTVTVSGSLALTISPNTSTICPGTPVVLVATGASNYTWSPSSTLNSANGTSVTATPSTNTTYTVIGASGTCTGIATASISTSGTISAVISSTTAAACGANTGGATVTATGGTSTYTYSWAPSGATTPVASNLGPGNNTVTVTDGNGCVATAVANISTTSGPTLSIVAQTSVSCFGGNNGTATVSATGGTGPYTYSWTPGNLTGATQNSLSAGVYTVTVKDANQCAGIATVSIIQPTAGVTGTISTTPTGCGTSVGSATVTASGGTPAYTYTWGPTAGSGTSISGLAVGSYSVKITDSKGCTVTVNASVNSTGTGPSLSVASQTNGTCGNVANGAATINASGTSPYTYTWSPSGGNAATATGLAGGTYTVLVADASLCVSTITVTITQPPPIVLTVTSTPANCGFYDGTATASATGGNGTLSYLWSTNTNSATASGLSSGTYSVLVTDATGCTATGFTNVNSVGTLTVDVGSNVTIFEGQSTQLNALIPFGANVVWTPTTGLSCTTCSNPIASPTVSTDYCALTTIGSCTNISCVSVFVEIDCASNSDYSTPNAFSPNGDGINDNFCLEGWKKCVTTFYVGIYNKWGEKVYESEEADFCWDGTFRGKALNPDVFVYYIKATIKDVGEILRKGNVTLVK